MFPPLLTARAAECTRSYVDTAAVCDGTFMGGYWCGHPDVLAAKKTILCLRMFLRADTGQPCECALYKVFSPASGPGRKGAA